MDPRPGYQDARSRRGSRPGRLGRSRPGIRRCSRLGGWTSTSHLERGNARSSSGSCTRPRTWHGRPRRQAWRRSSISPRRRTAPCRRQRAAAMSPSATRFASSGASTVPRRARSGRRAQASADSGRDSTRRSPTHSTWRRSPTRRGHSNASHSIGGASATPAAHSTLTLVHRRGERRAGRRLPLQARARCGSRPGLDLGRGRAAAVEAERVGLALLLHAFGDLYRRGFPAVGLSVHGENPTGAPRLYRWGMRPLTLPPLSHGSTRTSSDPSGRTWSRRAERTGCMSPRQVAVSNSPRWQTGRCPQGCTRNH